MSWSRAEALLRAFYIPIISDAASANWPHWREALKEVFVTLFFSLMPLWLGLFIVKILTIADGPSAFLAKFASNAELAILATSLLGPLLYMMFREDGSGPGNWLVPRFPGGLWFIMTVIGCCVVATVMYSLTYLSGTNAFHDASGASVRFINASTVATTSWILFTIVVLLILFACTIRNFIETRAPRMMSADTQQFVAEVEAAQSVPDTDAENLVDRMQAAQGEH
jgi:hypothetical protein